jgi:hypothetical protein
MLPCGFNRTVPTGDRAVRKYLNVRPATKERNLKENVPIERDDSRPLVSTLTRLTPCSLLG